MNTTQVRENVWHTTSATGSTLIVERMAGRDDDEAYVVTDFTPATGHYLICDGVSRADADAAVAKRV